MQKTKRVTELVLMLFFIAFSTSAWAQAVVLASATITGTDQYTIQLQGTNFGPNAYVDVRFASSGPIMAQYINSPPLTRWTSVPSRATI